MIDRTVLRELVAEGWISEQERTRCANLLRSYIWKLDGESVASTGTGSGDVLRRVGEELRTVLKEIEQGAEA